MMQNPAPHMRCLVVTLISICVNSFEDLQIKFSIPDELNREFFVRAGSELEKQDFPDLALRAFRTATLLLNEEESAMEHSLFLDSKQHIRDMIHYTKARRVGAFRALSATIELGPGTEPVTISWVSGENMRPVDPQ